jgi:hypothetical protein
MSALTEILIFKKEGRKAEEWLELHLNGELIYTVEEYGSGLAVNETLSVQEAKKRWPDCIPKIDQSLKKLAANSN